MTSQELTEWLLNHGITDSELDHYLKCKPFTTILWRFGRRNMPGWLKESLDLLEQRLDAEYFDYMEKR